MIIYTIWKKQIEFNKLIQIKIIESINEVGRNIYNHDYVFKTTSGSRSYRVNIISKFL